MRPQRTVAATLLGLTRALGNALVSEQIARNPGLLQALDPRVRLIGLLALVLAVTLSHRISVVVALFALALLLALLSHVALRSLAVRVWLVVLLFTGVIALPALFLTPGDPIVASPVSNLHITRQGVATALLLIMRVETAVTLTTLLVLTTPWMHILKALRALRVPQEVVMMLAMTHRYIFLLAETASQMFESRQSRMVGALSGSDQRRMATRTAGVLLGKSADLSYDVYLAMQSRGFAGDIRLLDSPRMKSLDFSAIIISVVIAISAVWLGR